MKSRPTGGRVRERWESFWALNNVLVQVTKKAKELEVGIYLIWRENISTLEFILLGRWQQLKLCTLWEYTPQMFKVHVTQFNVILLPYSIQIKWNDTHNILDLI